MVDADTVARDLRAQGVAPQVAAGCAVRRSSGFRVEKGGDAHVFFDLASLTKPMTAVAVLRSGLPLERTLGRAVSELRATASGDATMEALLSHRAGLAPHVALYAPLLEGAAVDTSEALARAADARRQECAGPLPAGGFPPLYSDLGYILAGAALARHFGGPDAGHAIEELVVAALGARAELGTARSLDAAGIDLIARAAPTEDVAWRGGVVRGRVHDENAWALTGLGGSGHAGMFGTLGAVLSFGCAVLDALAGRGPFAGADVAELARERPGGSLRAGFDGKSEEGSSAGASFGPRAFGHLGFTGTSLWIDPAAGVVVALLTNRVHPSRENTAIRAARPAAHEALFQRALLLR
jgi:CubicO group peptidase (beta-lactamase class C family)